MKSTIHAVLAAFLTLCATAALAQEVRVVGLFPGKAVLVVNGGKPRTLAAGQTTPEGVKLVSATSSAAEVEVDGKRATLGLQQNVAYKPSVTESAKITLSADASGHFMVPGSINGIPVRFLVDTGATMVSISQAQAKRMGINYLRGEPTVTMTANGQATVYRVRLDAVKVGELTVSGVDALVHDSDLGGVALLGMSVLSRLDMRREGVTLTLIQRF